MDTLERATVSRVGGKLGPASTDVAPPGNRESFESLLLLRLIFYLLIPRI